VDKITPRLDKLSHLIRLLAVDMNDQMARLSGLVESSQDAREELQSLEQMKACVQSGAKIVTSTTTILGLDDMASVAGASDFGDIFPENPDDNVLRWISDNTVAESEEPVDDQALASSSNPLPTVSGLLIDDSNSDGELEVEIVYAQLKKGREERRDGRLENAKKHLQGGLARLRRHEQRFAGSTVKMDFLDELQKTYQQSGDLLKAKDIAIERLQIISRNAPAADNMQYLGEILSLASILLELKDTAQARVYAKKCVKAYRKMGSSGQAGLEGSLRILIEVCQADGDVEEGDAYKLILNELPPEYTPADENTSPRVPRESPHEPIESPGEPMEGYAKLNSDHNLAPRADDIVSEELIDAAQMSREVPSQASSTPGIRGLGFFAYPPQPGGPSVNVDLSARFRMGDVGKAECVNLNRNSFQLRECTITGTRYTVTVPEKRVNNEPIDLEPGARDFSSLVRDLKNGKATQDMHQFLCALAVCRQLDDINSSYIQTSDIDTQLELTKTVDGTLADAAANAGYRCRRSGRNTVTLQMTHGKEVTYEQLAVCDFTWERMTFSVVYRCPDGKIRCYTKGTTHKILQKLTETQSADVDQTKQHLEIYKSANLLTTCIAFKEMPNKEFEEWHQLRVKAGQGKHARDKDLAEAADMLEHDLTLLGATALSERPEVVTRRLVKRLGETDFNIWAVTGDPYGPVLRISWRINLVTSSMSLLNFDECKGQSTEKAIEVLILVVFACNSQGCKAVLAINGEDLILVLDLKTRKRFLHLAAMCHVIICHNLTRQQESLVYNLVDIYKASFPALGKIKRHIRNIV
jgi:hypothetical protein